MSLARLWFGNLRGWALVLTDRSGWDSLSNLNLEGAKL